MRMGALVRFFIMTALMALTACFGFADPLSFFAGLVCLKLAAYAEPFIAGITAKVCAGIDEEAADNGMLSDTLRKRGRHLMNRWAA